MRYETESEALEALVVVRTRRSDAGEQRAFENHVYPCEECGGFHLSSTNERAEDLMAPTFQRTGETIENYARRLEVRIAEQRAQLLSLQVLGRGGSNRESRKRIQSLVLALGKMTERWESERRARVALTERLKEKRRWWRRG